MSLKKKEKKNGLKLPQPEMSMGNISSRLLMYSDACTLPPPYCTYCFLVCIFLHLKYVMNTSACQ